jgi:hypothetical protein
MAEHKVQGGNMLLFIDPNGGTDYDMVVCLTSVGTSMSVQPVDASSACGPDKSPGALEISYSFEGQHLQDPDGGKISGTDLRLLLNAEQTIGWKLSPETPVDGDEIQEGTGFISELSSTYAFDSVGTFTGTIMPYGTPTISIYGGGGGGLTLFIDGPNFIWYAGTPITVPFDIASATGGVPPYTFGITPAMPTGLIFDTTNGDISGTAVATQPLTAYVITVTDSVMATDSGPLNIEIQ